MPERHRAYLIDDEQIARHAALHAPGRPALSAATPDITPTTAESPQTAGDGQADGDGHDDGPEAALWAALLTARPDGAPITDLMAACGMGRSWVYYRLRGHARAGRAVQTTRGRGGPCGRGAAVRRGTRAPSATRGPRRPRGDVQ